MKQGQFQWQYYHCENAWPIVNVFNINSTNLNDHPVLKQKLLEISGVEHNNHLRGGIVNLKNSTDPSWVIAMQKMGYRYACVWFDGCWPAGHDFNNLLLDEIDRINEAFDEWLVAGQIKHIDDRFAYFENNMIIINLARWRGILRLADESNQDQLSWGRYSTCELSRDWPVDVLWENYKSEIVEWDSEDSLYAIQRFGDVMAAQKEKHHEPTIDDNVFEYRMGLPYNTQITASLAIHSDVIPGLSDDLFEQIDQTHPRRGSDDLEAALSGKEYDKDNVSFAANRLVDRMFNPSSPVYFVNTEPSQPMIAKQIEGQGFDQYVGATAGFKLFYYAQKYGFNTNTRFVLYDFDPLSCKFKEDLLTEWDGKNLPEYVDAWVENNPDANADLQDLTRERWPNVVNQFGGDAKWLETWNTIQQSDWNVVQCDLIFGTQTLLDSLHDKKTFLWTSNIYSYIIPKMLAGPFQLEESFINLIKKLKELDSESWFSGTDPNDNDLMCPVKAILSATNNESIGFEQ
jgi:hypothetical protein